MASHVLSTHRGSPPCNWWRKKFGLWELIDCRASFQIRHMFSGCCVNSGGDKSMILCLLKCSNGPIHNSNTGSPSNHKIYGPTHQSRGGARAVSIETHPNRLCLFALGSARLADLKSIFETKKKEETKASSVHWLLSEFPDINTHTKSTHLMLQMIVILIYPFKLACFSK